MYQKTSPQGAVFTFRRFSRKGYALFAALGSEVKIGVLTVATLATAAPCLAANTHAAARTATAEDRTEVSDELDDAHRLAEAVTTTSRAPLAADAAARQVVTLSREQLAAAGVASVNDVLKLCAGVDVRQRGSFGMQTDISINGGTFDQILLLVNGFPISNPQTGHNAAEFPLNLSDIERIEVLEGAASRVFGTQAFSGAVNIVTRRDARTALSLAGGSFGTAQAEARTGLQARHGNVDFTSSLSLGYGRSDGAVRNSDFRYGKAFWQGRVDAPDFRVDALFGLTQSDFGANTFYSTKSANQWEGTHRLLAGVRAETKGRLHLAPQVSWLRNADHFQFVRNTPKYENFNRGDVFTLGLNAWTDWAAGRTAFGAEMRQELIYSGNLGRDLDSTHWIAIGGKHADRRDDNGVWRDNDGSIAYYTKRAERTNVSYFVEHDLLFDRWTVSLGLMAQRNSSIDEQLRLYPGVDVAWRPNSAWRLTASWNRSLRLPTFTDLYYKNPSQEGNVGLRPEENSAFRLGATHHAPCGITVEAAAFYNRGTNVLDWVMYDAKDKFHSTNFRLDNFGVNVTATADFDRLIGTSQPLRRLRLDFARLWQDRKDDRPFFKSNYALEYLRHKFVATLDHRLFAHLGASWVLRVQDRNGHYMQVDRTNPAKLVDTGTLLPYGTHAILDVKLHWTTDRYRLFCDLRNVTNSRYFDLGNVEQPGFFVMAGASYTF